MPRFSELTGREKLVELLRWLGVLPASLVGFAIGYAAGAASWMSAEAVGIVDPPAAPVPTTSHVACCGWSQWVYRMFCWALRWRLVIASLLRQPSAPTGSYGQAARTAGIICTSQSQS